MNKQRKFILIAAVAGAISVFLPWITASAGAFGYSVNRSENGFHGAGVAYFMLMAAAGVVAAVIGERTQTLDKTMRLTMLACGAVGAICVFLFFKDAPDGFHTGYGGVDISPSFGAFVAFLAAVAVLVLPLVFKALGESLQGDFDHLKQKMKSINTSGGTPTNKPAGTGAINSLEELERLAKLKEQGSITDEEYVQMKAKIL